MNFRICSILEYNIVKAERKTDFIIQKRAKKILNTNPEAPNIVSPIKIIKVTDRYIPPTNPPTISNNINNLLSTKQLEPVQVHSVIANVEQQSKPEKIFSQPVDVKTLITTSSPSKSSSKKLDHTQSPRKKRDFYGKTNRSPHQANKSDASSSNKTRPSSTPAVSTEVAIKTNLPDRPVSIPPT